MAVVDTGQQRKKKRPANTGVSAFFRFDFPEILTANFSPH
jgi:hypothetical protein